MPSIDLDHKYIYIYVNLPKLVILQNIVISINQGT